VQDFLEEGVLNQPCKTILTGGLYNCA